MANLSSSVRVQADAIVVSSQLCYAPGQIELRHGRIVEVTGSCQARADIVLDGIALLPALVNPHTHLEFSDMEQPIAAGEDFPSWIGQVLERRRMRGVQAVDALRATIGRGLAESLAAGVGVLADIVTPPWSFDCLRRDKAHVTNSSTQPWHKDVRDEPREWLGQHLARCHQQPQVLACVEQLGLSSERMSQAITWRDTILHSDQHEWPDDLLGLALSPHAPYSTPPALWQAAAAAANARQIPLVMHLAESPAERQWLDENTGPMAEMLQRFGASDYRPDRDLIQQICTALGNAPRALLIHGNYLNESEMNHLSTLRDRISVVYCPRTHAHFNHQPYPWHELRSRGIRVVLGTDSRSTNPDLNLWQEGKTALHKHADLKPTEALSAITDSAAQALGLAAHYGSLTPGAVAAVACLPMPAHQRADDLPALLSEWFEHQPHPVMLAELTLPAQRPGGSKKQAF